MMLEKAMLSRQAVCSAAVLGCDEGQLGHAQGRPDESRLTQLPTLVTAKGSEV